MTTEEFSEEKVGEFLESLFDMEYGHPKISREVREKLVNLLGDKAEREMYLRVSLKTNSPDVLVQMHKNSLDKVTSELEDAVNQIVSPALPRAEIEEYLKRAYLSRCKFELEFLQSKVDNYNGLNSNCDFCGYNPENVSEDELTRQSQMPAEQLPKTAVKCRKGLKMNTLESRDCRYYELTDNEIALQARASILESFPYKFKAVEEMIEEHLKAGDSK